MIPFISFLAISGAILLYTPQARELLKIVLYYFVFMLVVATPAFLVVLILRLVSEFLH